MDIEVSTTITVDDYEIDQRILQAAGEALIRQTNMSARYGGAVEDAITAALTKIVSAKVDELLSKPVAQFDRYGDEKVPPKPFKEIVADRAESFLTERVEVNTGRLSVGSYSGGISRLEYLLREAGAGQFDAECRKVAKEFKDALQAKARDALTAVIAQHVKAPA